MASIAQKQLFCWEDIEEKGDLVRLSLVLNALPDETLMHTLESHRGKGTNNYPVRAVWNSIIAGIVFQHPSVESLRRELQRNGELRELCGFNTLFGAQAVPTPWAYTRFLQNLMNQRDLIIDQFDAMVRELQGLLPDFGEKLAFDGKAIASVARGKKKKEDKQITGDRRKDEDADWGSHEHTGTRADGTIWKKVKSWFGYKIHLVVDATYELPVAFSLTAASKAESPVMHDMFDTIETTHPKILQRCTEASGDRGYDGTKLINKLWESYHIKPVIDIRNMWKDGEETKLVRGSKNVVYNFAGEVSCICLSTGAEKRMSFGGFEEKRGTLKYRCPAQYTQKVCRSRDTCPMANKSIRIPLTEDRRVFTPLARSSYAWKTAYNRRTSVERVNGRIETSFGFRTHFIRGKAKMEVRCGLAMCVMLALAIGHIREKKPELMRSLVKTG
jgi:hypothetical protein